MKNLITLCCLLVMFSCKAQDTAIKKYANISATVLEKAVLAGGKLIRVKDFPSENITPRPVDVWLR